MPQCGIGPGDDVRIVWNRGSDLKDSTGRDSTALSLPFLVLKVPGVDADDR